MRENKARLKLIDEMDFSTQKLREEFSREYFLKSFYNFFDVLVDLRLSVGDEGFKEIIMQATEPRNSKDLKEDLGREEALNRYHRNKQK